MSLILPPSASNLRTMEAWCDAYSLCLEVRAEAAHDNAMRRQLNDAKRQLASDTSMDVSRRTVLTSSQEQINKLVQSFAQEDHAGRLSRWRSVRQSLMSRGWDLADDIEFEQDPQGGIIIWQRNKKDSLRLSGQDALMAYRFLLFVQETSRQHSDPTALVKQQLLSQGINAKNFHKHADKLLINNPWA